METEGQTEAPKKMERAALKAVLLSTDGALLPAAKLCGATRAWMEYHVRQCGLSSWAAKLRFKRGVSGGRSEYTPSRADDAKARRKIRDALRSTNSQLAAAKKLKIHRRRLQREMARLGVR